MDSYRFDGLSLLYVFLFLVALYLAIKWVIRGSKPLQDFTRGYNWAQDQLLNKGKSPRSIYTPDVDPYAEGVKAAIRDCIDHHKVLDF
jgi:hypothetical protein